MRIDHFLLSPGERPGRTGVRAGRSAFQQLGWSAAQENRLTKEVGTILNNFERLTNGLKFSAEYRQTNFCDQDGPISLAADERRLYLTLLKPLATCQTAPLTLAQSLAQSLILSSWHGQKVKIGGAYQTAQERFDLSGRFSFDRALTRILRNNIFEHTNNLIYNRLIIELLKGCYYPVRPLVTYFKDTFADMSQGLSQISDPFSIREISWGVMAQAALLAVIARKAGCHQLAQSWETGETGKLNRQLSFLQLGLDPLSWADRDLNLVLHPLKTNLQLARWQEENSSIFEGYCRVFEYCYDNVQVVSLNN